MKNLLRDFKTTCRQCSGCGWEQQQSRYADASSKEIPPRTRTVNVVISWTGSLILSSADEYWGPLAYQTSFRTPTALQCSLLTNSARKRKQILRNMLIFLTMWYCQFTLRTRRTERTFSFQSRRHSRRPSVTITPAEHVNRNAADSEEVLMHGSDELDDFAPSIREPERAFRIAILLLLCPGSPLFPTEAHQSVPSRSVERENVFPSTISLTVHLWFDKIQYTLRTTRLKLPPIWSEGQILRMRRITIRVCLRQKVSASKIWKL